MKPREPSISPAVLAVYIGAKVLARSDDHGWSDVLVQIFDQPWEQEAMLVPVVADPVISWTFSGSALVEDAGGMDRL